MESEQAQTESRQLFDDFIRRHTRGTLNQEITAAMSEVVKAVAGIGKKGKVTIELIVEPSGDTGRVVMIGGVVKPAPPLPDPERGIFYVGAAGTLHRDDPYAQRIPGVPYADTAGDIKVVEPETGEIRTIEGDV